jgi:hypothetical protein
VYLCVLLGSENKQELFPKGEIEVTGRRGRRRRKLLDDLKERRGYSHLKEEVLDRTMWRAGFGRGFGPVARQTTESMNDSINWLVFITGTECVYCAVRTGYLNIIEVTFIFKCCAKARYVSRRPLSSAARF